MKGYLLLIDSGEESPHPVIDLLRNEGYSVTSIRGVEGMISSQDLQVFDLVFLLSHNSAIQTDLIRELSSRVRKACPIYVIGSDDISQAVKAMHCGASYYWPDSAKSTDIRQFLQDGYQPAARASFGLRREETLLQVIKEIALTMELDGLVNILVDSAMELAGADAGVLLLLDEKTNHLVPRAVRGFSDLQSGLEYLGLPESRCFDILQGKLPILLHSSDSPVLTANQQPVKALMVIPVWFKDSALGELVLAKFATSGSHFSQDDFQLLSLFSGEISAAVYNAITHYKTKELTIKDDLTDAYNRRYFDQFLEQEFHRALRYNSHLSLIFFDVDNLKEVNAKYGHLTGSKTLQEVAHRMILVVRGIDKVVRYGGDEFCIVLPETDSQGAYQVADRLRITIAGRPFRINESIQVTLTGSFGIACFPDHATTKDELIRQADRAMFSIKNRTKNAIAVASVAG